MRLGKIGIAIAMAFVFIGCGAKGPQFSSFQNPSYDNAMIYVYRPSSFGGAAISYNVNASYDGKNLIIGTMSNGAYASMEVPANKEVEVWAKTESKSSITIDTQANQIYCIKATLGIGFFVGRPNLTQVDWDTCQQEIVKTKLDE